MLINMARTGPIPPSKRSWKYILLLQGGGAFFSDTLFGLVKNMFNSWRKRCKQWAD